MATEREGDVAEVRRRGLISPDNLIPLGVAVVCAAALVSGAIGAYTWFDTQFDELRSSNTEINRDTAEIRKDVGAIETVLQDRITKPELESYMELLFAKNPTLVPVEVH